MLSTAHSGFHGTLQFPSFPSQRHSFSFRTPKFSISRRPEALSRHPSSIPELTNKRSSQKQRSLTCGAAPEEVAAEETPTAEPQGTPHLSPEKQAAKVVVKQMAKPRLVLKFIWMEKNIGLGLDQLIPGHGTIPLSPYYFWPRKDAWEELKNALESKPWISQKTMIILLNQATDIINLWQQSGGNLS